MINTVPKLFIQFVQENPELPALWVKNREDRYESVTFSRLLSLVSAMASGLDKLGIKRGDHVGIISDNRQEWIITDLAILGLGAADVPRGSDATRDEILYILSHADCSCAFVENQVQLEKLISIEKKLPVLKHIIVMNSEYGKIKSKKKIHSFAGIMENGEKRLQKDPDFYKKKSE